MDENVEPQELSSDEEEEESSGHPIETKETVIQNIANGFRYHKNGPAQPYNWNKDDLIKMTKLIKEAAKKVTRGRRKIRAIRYDGKEFPGGLLGWVNNVRKGLYFSDNPNVNRGPVFKSGEKSNHWLWNFVSETLLAEVDFWTKIHKANQKCDPEQSKYPDLEKLIFRHPDDFVGGLWTDFEKHWQRFVDEMRLVLSYLPFASTLFIVPTCPVMLYVIYENP